MKMRAPRPGVLAVLCLTVLASGAAAGGAGAEKAAGPTRWERSAQERRELGRGVIGLTHEPIEFLMRRGDHFDDEPEHYQQLCEPENIRRMAASGSRYGRLFFYKGFGLEYERTNMETAKKAAALMHELGMKVDLYVGGTMFPETLYHELPEAEKWEQRDQNNQWVPYGVQTFRHYACPNEPAYRAYLHRALKIGIEELHADQISFDNIMLQSEPKSCRCPRCIRAFHDYLRRKYPTEEAMRRRFGLPEADWVRVTEWATPAQAEGLGELNDPVLQEWERFRCESLANYARALYDDVKSLNPNVSVLFNIKGVYSYNRYWANAVYHPLYAGHIDVLSFDTGGYEARLDAGSGALVSQIRSYKEARRLKASCEEGLGDDLRAALHMAFKYETTVAGYPGAPALAKAVTPFLEFYREYRERYYTGTEEVADVAVLRNWPSIAYSMSATYVPATLMEQTLIQHKIPFDLLFDEDLGQISRYQAVILAGQECVGDAQAEQLLRYAREGGTVVLTGNTGTYNEWRERRHSNPLLPARREGKGRILYIPEIIPAARAAKESAGEEDAEPGATLRRTARMTPAQWVLPRNHEAIAQTVVEGLPKGLSITTGTPLTTVMDLLTRPGARQTLAHFINFDRDHKLGAFQVRVRKQFSGPIKKVECLSPEWDDPLPVAFEEAGEEVVFTIPGLRLYAMAVITQ